MSITRLAHVCLNVVDLEASLRFYRDRLGLPVAFTFRRKGEMIGAYVQVGPDNFIEMFVKAGNQTVNTGIVHLCLEVDDLTAEMRRLANAGVPVSGVKLGCDHSYQAWIQDPDGNRIELHQYTPESAQKVGGVVEVDW